MTHSSMPRGAREREPAPTGILNRYAAESKADTDGGESAERAWWRKTRLEQLRAAHH